MNEDGTVDSSFKEVKLEGHFTKAIELSDGSVAIFTEGQNTYRQINRINSSGTLDSSYGTHKFTGHVFEKQSNDRILLSDYDYDLDEWTVIRLRPDGTKDPSFQLTDYYRFEKIAVDKFDDLLTVKDNDGKLHKYSPNGKVDPNFLPGDAHYGSFSILFQSDNKIVLIGDFSMYDNVAKNGQVRLNNTNKTGIQEKGSGPAKFVVSPNPVGNQFTIQAKSSKSRVMSIAIHDAAGKLIDTIIGPELLNPIINCSNWKSGIYFLSISSEDETSVLKVLK